MTATTWTTHLSYNQAGKSAARVLPHGKALQLNQRAVALLPKGARYVTILSDARGRLALRPARERALGAYTINDNSPSGSNSQISCQVALREAGIAGGTDFDAHLEGDLVVLTPRDKE